MAAVLDGPVLDGPVTKDLRWTAIVPVKDFRSAKSRLRRADVPSERLARAFLEDMLGALRASHAVAEIRVATHDPAVAEVAASAGAVAVDDRGFPGINAAASHAARTRASGTGIAILVSDLPCLTDSAVGLALELASRHATSFVADADGTGTSMWLSPHGVGLPARFGPDSRQAHLTTGAVDLTAQYPREAPGLLPARLDVDTEAALDTAIQAGVGPHTADVLAS